MTTKKKRGLGKGLNALLGPQDPATPPLTASTPAQGEHVHELAIEQLQRGRYQPRKEFEDEALRELSESIRRQGVLQPMVVRQVEKGYEIVAGERRWRASKMAGLKTVPCLVREINDHQAAAIGLIENLQRSNLNPLEQSEAFSRLQAEFGLTHQEIADVVGRSRAAVSNLLRLAELEPQVCDLVNQGLIDMGHARALLALKDQQQVEIAEEIASKSLSVRQSESLIRSIINPSNTPPQSPEQTAELAQQAQHLSQSLGYVAAIKHNAKGKGKIEISFNSKQELEVLLQRFSGANKN